MEQQMPLYATNTNLIIYSIILSVWMAFFIDRWFVQSTIYHLIGRSDKLGISCKFAEKSAKLSFSKYNFLILSGGMWTLFISIGVIVRLEESHIISIICVTISIILFTWFGCRSLSSYRSSFRNLEEMSAKFKSDRAGTH